MNLILCALDSQLYSAFKRYFASEKNVTIYNDDFRNVPAYDCIVSPANSFGLMDGGFDGLLTHVYGVQLMRRVQEKILAEYAGEQPVGTCIIVKTGNPRYPYCAHTPTMRVPKSIAGTENIYNAMRAMLLEVQKHKNIQTVLCPGLGTMTGRMLPDEAVRQMYLAYKSIQNPPNVLNWDVAIQVERGLQA